MMWLYTVAIFM